MSNLTQFDVQSARRIARVVQAVEQEPQRARALGFEPVFDGKPSRALLCKTAAAWDKNTVATLNVWQSGTPPNETQTSGRTVQAVNKMHWVAAGLFVLVKRAGNGAWYLIESEMPPVLSGTFSGSWSKTATKSVSVSVGSVSFSVTANNRFVNITGTTTRNCAVAYDGSGFQLIAAEC